MHLITLLTCVLLLVNGILSQPVPETNGVSVDHILNLDGEPSCIAFDARRKQLYAGTVDGNIFRIDMAADTVATMVHTVADHGIPYLQGMVIRDSAMFLIGNDWTDGTKGIGWVKRGTLEPNGQREWSTVVQTEAYPAAHATFDHGFSGLAIDGDGTYLYISSGSRTDHGEIQSTDGLYPGVREVPLTSAVFRVQADARDLFFPNDEALLKAGGWWFADGTRNSFSLALNARNELFGLENSGDRDDPEEMNWLREGRHYGFPWNMGGNLTPQQFAGYNPDHDPLVNPNSAAYQLGKFHDDPTFPAPPDGITFTAPLQNYGPHAQYYRSETDGRIYTAMDEPLTTFTMHRSPLGLTFDTDSLLAAPYCGNGFMLSFTQGQGDSSGYHPGSVWGLPVVPIDTSQDLLHLHMMYDAGANSYALQTTRIARGFNFPVDAVLTGTDMYVLEFGTPGNRNIWKITLPGKDASGVSVSTRKQGPRIYPNPALDGQFTLQLPEEVQHARIHILDLQNKTVYAQPVSASRSRIDLSLLAPGTYVLGLKTGKGHWHRRLVIR